MAATVDDYLNKINEASRYVDERVKQRGENQSKLKTQYGYDDRMKGLEGINRQVLNAERVLSDLPDDVTRRTAGRLVTSAQRNRLLASEQRPLAATVGNLSRTAAVQGQDFDRINALLAREEDLFNRDTDARHSSLLGEADSLMKSYDLDWRERQAQLDRQQRQREADINARYQSGMLDIQRKQLAAAARAQQLQQQNAAYRQNLSISPTEGELSRTGRGAYDILTGVGQDIGNMLSNTNNKQKALLAGLGGISSINPALLPIATNLVPSIVGPLPKLKNVRAGLSG